MKTKDIIANLMKEEIVVSIETIFKKLVPNSTLKMAKSTQKSQKNTIYFLIDTNETMSLSDVSEVKNNIMDIIGCKTTDEEENIFIYSENTLKPKELEKNFSETVVFSNENFSKLDKFLSINYKGKNIDFSNKNMLINNFNERQIVTEKITDNEKNIDLNSNEENLSEENVKDSDEEIICDFKKDLGELFHKHEKRLSSIKQKEKFKNIDINYGSFHFSNLDYSPPSRKNN